MAVRAVCGMRAVPCMPCRARGVVWGGVKGEMGEMFAATERYCAYLRNIDACSRGHKVDPQIVHLSAVAWLKSSTCIAMSYFVSGPRLLPERLHHDYCRNVSTSTLEAAQRVRDMKVVNMCHSLLAHVDLLDGRVEAASARVASTLDLSLAMKVSSPQFLCMLVGVGDAQAQLGNTREAHATWRAAEGILRTQDMDASAGASVSEGIATQRWRRSTPPLVSCPCSISSAQRWPKSVTARGMRGRRRSVRLSGCCRAP